MGAGCSEGKGERAGEEKPPLILCPSASLRTSPVCPAVVGSESRVCCRWRRGALLGVGGLKIPRVCLPDPPFLSCAWRNGPSSGQPPPVPLPCWTQQLWEPKSRLSVGCKRGKKERKKEKSCGYNTLLL